MLFTQCFLPLVISFVITTIVMVMINAFLYFKLVAYAHKHYGLEPFISTVVENKIN